MSERHAPPPLPPGVLAVRPGPGANCSSIGSTIDILFVAGTVAAAVVAALAALAPPPTSTAAGPVPLPSPPDPRALPGRRAPTMAREPRATFRAALALAAGCATVALLYAGVRAFQLAFFDEPNPAMIIWSARAALFWRLLIGLYAAVPVAIGAWAAARTRPEATARWVVRGVLAAGVAILAQGLALP